MKTVINIKTEKELKQQAKEVAEELGLSLSTVVNAYLRQFTRNKEVYFSVTPRLSREFEKLLGTIESDIRKERKLSRPVSSAHALKKHLSAL